MFHNIGMHSIPDRGLICFWNVNKDMKRLDETNNASRASCHAVWTNPVCSRVAPAFMATEEAVFSDHTAFSYQAKCWQWGGGILAHFLVSRHHLCSRQQLHVITNSSFSCVVSVTKVFLTATPRNTLLGTFPANFWHINKSCQWLCCDASCDKSKT